MAGLVLKEKIRAGLLKVNKGSPPEWRFWKRIEVSGPVHPVLRSRCWSWVGTRRNGYGRISVGARKVAAHRFSWELHNGEIPSGLDVLHRCDNPGCVNPEHLFLGDDAANVADCVAKGRHARGERKHTAKLTEQQVRDIRRRYANGKRGRTKALAQEYGVSTKTIVYVVYHGWTHVV